MHHAIARAEQIGTSRATTVLITGETGSGKELFARGIHSVSQSAHEPFVALSCSAVPEGILERELFGYEPGVFPDTRGRKRGLLEIAGRGTLLLDDVSELPRTLQRRVLHVLERRTFRRLGGSEEHPVVARIIALTTLPLEEAVSAGTFQRDLFDQLNVVRLELPALRERGADVELLALHLLSQTTRERGAPPSRLSTEAINALHGHPWPGNVRELRSVIARAVLLCSGDTILRRHLLFQRRRVVPDAGEMASVIQIPPDGKPLDAIVHEAIHVTLLLTQGNLSAAARILGISRPTLTRKLRETGVLRSAFHDQGGATHHEERNENIWRHERGGMIEDAGDGLLKGGEPFPAFDAPEPPGAVG